MSRSLIVRYHRPLFFLPILLAYAVVLFGIAGIRDAGHAGHSLARLATAGVELGLAGLLCAGCMRAALRGRRGPWLLLSLAIAVVVAIVYLAQAYSLYVSRNFISTLAMQNAGSVAFVESKLLQLGVVAIAGWAALFWMALRKATRAPRAAHGAAVRWPTHRYSLATIGCGLLFAYLFFIQGDNLRLEPGFRQSPVVNLAVSAYRYRFAEPDDLADAAPGAAPSDAACFAYDRQGSDYPFVHPHAFESPLPFPRRAGAPATPPNIVIVFIEGMSARLVGAYGGRYPGLTPALDQLATHTMQVDGYFNHTAATFRGLEGQLSSGFSFAGGEEGWNDDGNRAALVRIRRQTLPRVVDQAGYDSDMFEPHKHDKPLVAMLQALGFDRVHAYESINDELLGGNGRSRPGTGALDDQSLFDGLVAFLQRRAAAGNRKPFFVATYNIGTHAFLHGSPGDLAYRGQGNPVLDKMHNLDAALGVFLRYFFASPYAANTVLVVTADHATYPEPAYRDLEGEQLKPYFVDRIPLFVYDPFHRLPRTLDAQGRNSLDLAPTVLQLAGLQTHANAFLGRSLFEPRSLPVGISALGSKYYMTLPEGTFGMNEIPPAYRDVFHCETTMVRRFYAAERDNRIMPASSSAVAASAAKPIGVSGTATPVR